VDGLQEGDRVITDFVADTDPTRPASNPFSGGGDSSTDRAAMTAGATLVSLEQVSKIYRNGDIAVRAVHDVTLQIVRGEFLAVMGASGSGKSTLMNILGCLDRPSSGRYMLDGLDVSGLDRDQLADLRNQKLGFVFQGFHLLPRTSALENVELPMSYARGLTAAQQRERAVRALEIVGLADRAEHHPNQLSGGQQQRVAIARSLVNEPVVLLADEPTGNLDTRTSMEIMGVFQGLNTQGLTVVMVTHEHDIARYAKRTIVMRDGRIVEDSSVRDRLSAADELRRLPPLQPVGA
jgi:putative ABC transport system ATP-binding protein